MTNQTQGRKISNFPASTTVPSTATFSFVDGSTNYKITYANLLSAFNFVGSIAQLGSSKGTPVLDKQGSVNRIRNLEAGSGISVSISVQNGAKISHNIANGGTGDVALFQDLTATQLIAKKIKAGTGITVTDNGTDIEISLT